MIRRKPAEVFPPGEFLREELEERGWTQADLAEILNRSARLVNEIIAGKRAISPETAKALSAALGTSAEYWLNLESTYQLWRVKGDDNPDVSMRARLYDYAPIKAMVRRGWITSTDNVDVLQKQVVNFFEVQSLDEKPAMFQHAARKSASYADTTKEQRAWFYRARKLARAVPAESYSKAKLKAAVERLRPLIRAPEEARQVASILGDAGIRFLIVEALPGTRIDGACFWIDRSPVIAMALRFDRIDNFWFTLMHEIAHVSAGDDSLDADVEGSGPLEGRPEYEIAADEFARENLIPLYQLERFIARTRPLYSARRIEAFAQDVNVHPAIVVGRLQHCGEVAWSSFRGLMAPIREFVAGSTMTDGWGRAIAV